MGIRGMLCATVAAETHHLLADLYTDLEALCTRTSTGSISLELFLVMTTISFPDS